MVRGRHGAIDAPLPGVRSEGSRVGEEVVMALKLEKTKTSHLVEVPRERAGVLFEMAMPVSMCAILSELEGVSDVTYDGHLGPFVYLTIEEESDTPRKHAMVCAVIESSLRATRRAGK
jgi:hypothetical protein